MPKFGSLRGKMLALILTPVTVAIILVTLLAISRASSDQETAAFAELKQRTAVEAAEGRRDDRRRAGHRRFSAALSWSTAPAAPTPSTRTRRPDRANSKSIMAVFSSTLPNTLRRQRDAPARRARHRPGRQRSSPSVTLTEKGTIAAAARQPTAQGRRRPS